jgi:hypothetical protein
MKNREDAEEVTQDVLMKVYRKIGAFRGDSALSSWIYRITFNTAMSRLRAPMARRVPSLVRALTPSWSYQHFIAPPKTEARIRPSAPSDRSGRGWGIGCRPHRSRFCCMILRHKQFVAATGSFMTFSISRR